MKFPNLPILYTSLIITFSSIVSSELSDAQRNQLLEQLPPDQRASIMTKMDAADSIEKELEEIFSEEAYMQKKPEWKILEELKSGNNVTPCPECIFGYEYFKYAPTTFAPINNSAVTSDYLLGPGDELIVNLYGTVTKKFLGTINREGNLFVDPLGPVNLMGLSFTDAVDILEKRVEADLLGTKISISLKDVRAINVYFLGEAYQPGKYTMSGLSNVSNALIASGGVNKNGSLRNIEIKRNDITIAVYDFYEFLLKGSMINDIKLQDGDVIFIPFIKDRVKLGGAFKRPGNYELTKNDTVSDAVFLGGGFKNNVPNNSSLELSYLDKKSAERVYLTLDTNELDMLMMSGDSALNVSSKSGIEVRTIKVTGEVRNPGEYAIRPGDKVLDVLNRAGGINKDSYTEGTVFLRTTVADQQKEAFIRSADELENTIIDIVTKGAIDNITEFTLTPISNLITRLRDEKPVGRMVVDFDLLSLKTDPIKNFLVRNGDQIHIPKRPNSISVVGEVLYKNTLIFDPNMSVYQYVDLAGGMKDSADTDKIYIILPNGRSELVKKSLFSSKNILLPGSTIVVSRNPRPFDALSLTEIVAPIFANLATSAAAIAAISD